MRCLISTIAVLATALQPAWADEAKLRVSVRRGDSLVPAKVIVLTAKSAVDAPPVATGPANQRFELAAGTYDLLVQAEAQAGAEAPWVRVPAVKLGGALKEVAVDLADGKLEVALSDNGKKAEGSVRVFRAGSKTVVQQAEAGAPITLVPGPYRVEVVLSGASDYPARSSELWIEPRKTAKLSEKFETGRLTVGVFRDRQPVEAVVQLALPGATDFFNYFSAPGTVSLSPGSYDVLVKPKGGVPVEVLKRPRVVVSKGKDNKIFFDLTPAQLVVKVLRAGKAIGDAEVRAVQPGGGEEVARPEADGSFKLWPGRYELAVKLPDGEELRDGPFEVGFGEKLSRTVEFSRVRLSVHATRGGAAADEAEVFVFKPGAQKPLAQGRSGAILELPPGAYDVKITAGPETVWREGVKLKEGDKLLRLDVALAAKSSGAEPLPEGE